MADTRLRTLARSAARGDLNAAGHLLAERARLGTLCAGRIRLAGRLGDPAAAWAAGLEPSGHVELREFLTRADRAAPWYVAPAYFVRIGVVVAREVWPLCAATSGPETALEEEAPFALEGEALLSEGLRQAEAWLLDRTQVNLPRLAELSWALDDLETVLMQQEEVPTSDTVPPHLSYVARAVSATVELIHCFEQFSCEFAPVRRLKHARDVYNCTLHHRAANGAANALRRSGMSQRSSEARVKHVIRAALVPWLLEPPPGAE